MGGNLFFLPSAERVEVCQGCAGRAGAHAVGVTVRDDSQAAAGIHKGEVAIVDLSREPREGQYAGVETAEGFWLGYVSWEGPGARLLVEPACGCRDCRAEEVATSEVKSLGPVVGVCGRGGRGCRSLNITKAGTRLRQLL